MWELSEDEAASQEQAASKIGRATIIPFPQVKPRPPRFRPLDRAILGNLANQLGPVATLEVRCNDDPEFGEFASLTRAGKSWSEWNVAPHGNLLALWSGVRGIDFGKFDSMYSVFETLNQALAEPDTATHSKPSGTLHNAKKVAVGRRDVCM